MNSRRGCRPGEKKIGHTCVKDDELFKNIYDKYDGKYGDLVQKYIEEMKLVHRLARKIDRLEKRLKT